MENLIEPEPPMPRIGDWYVVPQGVTFEVVAVDEEEGSIEVQYFDGTLAEYDVDTWRELNLHEIDPPEDWSGSLDIEREDYGVEFDDEARSGMWANPLDNFDL